MNSQRANSLLQNSPHSDFMIYEIKPGDWHLLTPHYYPDRDPVDIYVTDSSKGPAYVLLRDHGLTDMRVSFLLEIDNPEREKIYADVLAKHGVRDTDAGMKLDVLVTDFYEGVDTFARCALELCHQDTWIEELRLHGPITEAVGTPVQN